MIFAYMYLENLAIDNAYIEICVRILDLMVFSGLTFIFTWACSDTHSVTFLSIVLAILVLRELRKFVGKLFTTTSPNCCPRTKASSSSSSSSPSQDTLPKQTSPEASPGDVNDVRLRMMCMSITAKLPSPASHDAACYNLYSDQRVTIKARDHVYVDTHVTMRLPHNTVGRIVPRFSLFGYGIDVGASVIEENYRGTIRVVLFNHSDELFEVAVGSCIAQLLIQPIVHPKVMEVSRF